MWNCVPRDSILLTPYDCACNMHLHQGQWQRIKYTTITLQWRQSFSWPWPSTEKVVDNWWLNCKIFQVCFNILCSYFLYKENIQKDKRPTNMLECNKNYQSTWQWVAPRWRRKERKKKSNIQWCLVLHQSPKSDKKIHETCLKKENVQQKKYRQAYMKSVIGLHGKGLPETIKWHVQSTVQCS
jgi:hypothetical protein